MVDKSPSQPNLTARSPWWVAGAGFVILAGSCGVYLIYPIWVQLAHVGVSIGAILLLVAILLQPDAIHILLAGRSVKYASNAGVVSLAFIGILVFLNYLSLKSNVEFDLTETGEFTLSEQTIEVLNNLTEPIQVKGFFRIGDYRWKKAKEYLERYSRYTPLLSYTLHDPSAEPSLAESYQLKHYGLVFINGVHRYEVLKIDEQAITTGLMCVTNYKDNMETEKYVPIRPKKHVDRQLFLTPFQTGLTLIVTVIVIPLAFVVAGIRVWWIRR